MSDLRKIKITSLAYQFYKSSSGNWHSCYKNPITLNENEHVLILEKHDTVSVVLYKKLILLIPNRIIS